MHARLGAPLYELLARLSYFPLAMIKHLDKSNLTKRGSLLGLDTDHHGEEGKATEAGLCQYDAVVVQKETWGRK